MRYKATQAADKELSLQACLDVAYDTYKKNWNLSCPKFGLNKKDEDCTLPGYLADNISKDYKEDQELCIKKYK